MSPPLETHQSQWVERSLHLVDEEARRLARRLAGAQGAQVDDLLGVGHEALVRAAMTYDPARGVPFGAFARTKLRWAMKDHLRRENPGQRRYERALRELDRLDSVVEAAPSNARGDMKDALRKYQERVRTLAMERFLSRTLEPSEATELPDDHAPSPEAMVAADQDRKRAQALLRRLEPQDRELMEAMLYQQVSMSEYAEQKGVSASTISRRHARILDQMRRDVAARPPQTGPAQP